MPASPLLAVSTPLGADAFILTGFTGREELSRPFAFQLEMVADISVTTVDPTQLVGKAVGWTVSYPAASPRQFHGLVRRLSAGEILGRTQRVYRAEVVPWLWFLTRAADCKIFQSKTAVDIIKAVFGQFGFSDFTDSTTATYPTRDYCVQYRETAFDFVSRLMEEEGIFYSFTYTSSAHTLVLADATSAYADCAPHNQPAFRPDLSDNESISSWDHRFEFRSGKYTHTDYNFETPATSLLATTATIDPLSDLSKYELFDYPGRHTVGADGTARSKSRMEEVEVGYDTVAGASRCSSFLPAGTFTIQGHVADTAATVLTAVEHTASEPLTAGVRGGSGSYANTFTCIPAAVKFRPERRTAGPLVPGPQPAVVVGPSGEEIYTDNYGRVKVQFFWDRVGTNDENSSCWLRVSELWAGQNWGMVFTPRIGQEVLVDFLEGDPDRPIVTGRVYNATQMPPYALPDNMTKSGLLTRSSKGGAAANANELHFEDKMGSENIFFHAEKDFHREVENDDDLKVFHDQTITIKNNRTEEVQEGNETITITKGDRTETVKQGNESVTIETGNRTVLVKQGDDTHTVQTGKRTVTVKADDTLTVQSGNRAETIDTGNRDVKVTTGNDTTTVSAGNHAIKVSAGTSETDAATSITLKVGGCKVVIDTSSVTIEAAAKITLKVGGNSVEVAAAGVTIKGINCKMQADAEATVQGAVANLNGDGMAKVKGGVVMIN